MIGPFRPGLAKLQDLGPLLLLAKAPAVHSNNGGVDVEVGELLDVEIRPRTTAARSRVTTEGIDTEVSA